MYVLLIQDGGCVCAGLKEIMNMSRENAEGRYLCILCNRTISTKYHLKVHLETQHGEKSHPRYCPVCSKVSKNMETLRSHMLRYHKQPLS
jgi:uncharacterized Zn-finger protein